MLAVANDEDPRGKLLFETKNAKGVFEVFENKRPNELPFKGYHNGKLSVAASTASSVIIGLQRKHVIGLPEGKLIDFTEAARRLQEKK